MLLATAHGCGKRGDPLPPLRPVPAPAENVTVRQVGDRIRLGWSAPVRNTDGTTERVDLREARVLRRVIDLDALVEEQTVVVAPEVETPASEVEAPAPDMEAPEPEVQAPEPEVETPEEEEPQEPPEEETGLPAEPAVVERPTLQIPPFAGDVAATLDSAELGERLFYEETLEPSWIGKRVEYAVLYVNGKNRRSPLSPIAQIEPRDPLVPPTNVEAETGDGFVRVEWTPPSPPSPEDQLGYAVYRRPEANPEFPDAPLGGAPVRETAFEDRGVVFGAPWCYAVKSMWRPAPPPAQEPLQTEEVAIEAASEPEPEPEPEPEREPEPEAEAEASPAPAPGETFPEVVVPLVPPIGSPPVIESELSSEICLTPEDVFPPPAPSDLVAVAAPSGVLLTWRVVEAPDLAGYRVYRSDRPDGAFELLAEVTVGSYTDEEAEPGRTYYYAVTAIDETARVNESDRTQVVEAVRPPPR